MARSTEDTTNTKSPSGYAHVSPLAIFLVLLLVPYESEGCPHHMKDYPQKGEFTNHVPPLRIYVCMSYAICP